MKKRKVKKETLIISILLFIVFILFILLYFSFNAEKEHQPIKYKNIKEVNTENIKLSEIKELHKENEDLIGWLQIEDTKIDYPVMYTKGQDYYLYRDFYKKKYNPGTLFVDKYNNVEPRDTNLIIHGHNMDDGSMFHDLEKYLDENFYKNHKTFKFYSLNSEDIYAIISVFKSKVYKKNDNVFKYYKFYNAKNEDEFDSFIKNIKALEIYETGVSAKYGDVLVTLSTCEYSIENGRLVIVAKKIA